VLTIDNIFKLYKTRSRSIGTKDFLSQLEMKSSLFLFVFATLVKLHRCLDEFDFSAIKYTPWCGDLLRHKLDNWTVEVSVYFNSSNVPIDVSFQMGNSNSRTRNVCAVKLEDCNNTIPSLPEYNSTKEVNTFDTETDQCTCIEDDWFTIALTSQAIVEDSGQHLKAVITEGNLRESISVGVVPTIRDVDIQVEYCIDGGDVTLLLPRQTVSLCSDDYVLLEICVKNPATQSTVRISLNNQTVQANMSCIHIAEKFDFRKTDSYPLVFYYEEFGECPVTRTSEILFLPEKGCVRPDVGSAEADTHTARLTSDPCTDPTSPGRLVTVLSSGLKVMCDTQTDGGGWVIFHRRVSYSVSFVRNWKDYTVGFGELTDNFWLGLDKIHTLCSPTLHCELLIDLKIGEISKTAKYSTFYISGPGEFYKLYVSGYSGNAGDGLLAPSRNGQVDESAVLNGMSFSTLDQDNDLWSGHCAELYHERGGWWYNACYLSNLNERWGDNVWFPFHNNVQHVEFSEMKIRQKL